MFFYSTLLFCFLYERGVASPLSSEIFLPRTGRVALTIEMLNNLPRHGNSFDNALALSSSFSMLNLSNHAGLVRTVLMFIPTMAFFVLQDNVEFLGLVIRVILDWIVETWNSDISD